MMRAALDYCVVIPAYNAAQFVHDALVSFAQQTLLPREIVVVDDGSRDSTAKVARRSSPVIAFLDADDEWMPGYAVQLSGAMHASGVVYGSTGIERFVLESCASIANLPEGSARDIRNDLLVNNLIVQSSAAVRRDVFCVSGGYDKAIHMAEDHDLWNRLALLGSFAYVPAPTVSRRIHSGQITHGTVPLMIVAAWKIRRHGGGTVRAWRSATKC